jgi:hypothetical protein
MGNNIVKFYLQFQLEIVSSKTYNTFEISKVEEKHVKLPDINMQLNNYIELALYKTNNNREKREKRNKRLVPKNRNNKNVH